MIDHLVFILLFLIGLYAVLVKKSLIKMVIGLSIMEASLFFWVIAISDEGNLIPIYHKASTGLMNDPVPQALILTGIVIGASTTALLLTFIIELNKFTDTIELDQLEGMWD
mgnify:CR=1 FL=1